MRTTARRARTYILRTIFLAGLVLLVLYLGRRLDPHRESQQYRGRSVSYLSLAQQVAELHEVARQFFRIFSLSLVGAMAAVGPILTATAISSERQHRTLDVLMMTPVSAWQIVTGKMLSRLLIVLTLLGLSLPAMTLVRLLGGIELWQIVGVLGIGLATAVAGASVGLLYSALLRRPYAIIVMSLATQLCVYLFVPFLQRHFEGNTSYEPQVTAINPFFSTINVCEGGLRWKARNFYTAVGWINLYNAPAAPLPLPPPVSGTWQPLMLTHLSAAAVLTLVVAWQVRRYARRATGGESIAPTGLILGPRDAPRSESEDHKKTNLSSRFRAGRRLTVGDNPVRWREIRRPLMTVRWHRYLGSILVGGALLLTYIAYFGSGDYLSYAYPTRANAVFNLSFFALIGVLSAVLSATAIAGEKDADTWLILLASPLTPSQIIFGKLFGLARRLLWPAVLVVAHYAVFVYTDLLSPDDARQYVWIIFTFSSLWMATGLYLSLRIGHATVAVILNLVLPIIIYGSTWVIWTNFGNRFEYGYADSALWGWPLMYLHPAWKESVYYSADIPSVALYAGVIHLLLAAFILTYTIGRFDRIVGRSPVRPFQWRLVPRVDAPPSSAAGG